MARFYVLAIDSTLFGDTAVIIGGRFPAMGRRRLKLHCDPTRAVEGSTTGSRARSGAGIASVDGMLVF
jgi:hypothetical protein